MNDFETAPPDPNEKPAAFCQNCGKPLTKDTVRVVGQSIYCEPCLDAKVNGPHTTSGYTTVNNPAGPAVGATGPIWGSITTPNPGLAFLLGLIPGVGAMYNEQYAKGLVHLTVFAFLVVLSHASLIFLLFVFGWIFYMAIEAHHTAQAKRDGLPLPNPFGLNDIGERMGFQSWTTPNSVVTAARDAAQTAGFRPNPVAASGYSQTTPPPQPGAWGAPVDAYADPYATPPAYAPPYTEQGWQTHNHQSYSQNYPPYGAAMPPYAPPFVPPPFVPPARNRFPAGAVWLIGLGALFLLGTENVFSGIRGQAVVGAIFLAFGGTLFARRFTTFDDQTASPQFRMYYALRVSVWLMLIGVLILLDSFNILYWSHSWPLLIILVGVMMLLNRAPFLDPYPLPPAAPVTGTPASEMTRLNLEPDPPATHHDPTHHDSTNGGN